MNAALAAQFASIRRPRILIRAARAGIAAYDRDGDPKRLPQTGRTMRSGTLATLLDEESHLESRRRSGEATYSIQEHVAVLTALILSARASADITSGASPAAPRPGATWPGPEALARPARRP